MTCRLQPLRDRVIVRRIEADAMTKSGILHIPEGAKEKPREGQVLAIGEGYYLDSGQLITPKVKPGDSIIFGKFAGTEFNYEGEMYLILKEEDILSVVIQETQQPTV